MPAAVRPARPSRRPGESAPPALPPRYRVLDRLGVGGIGQVWRAEDANLGRDLAVKCLRPDRRTPEHAARLAREALLTGRLQHPGVPPVVEQGVTDDGGPFFAMKLVGGRTLRELLKETRASVGRQPHERSASSHDPEAQGADAPRSPDDLPRLLTIFRQVCDAVGYAHSEGVIHRDLKPSNVMVGDHGEVQVMDWGMARLIRGEVEGAADESTFLAMTAASPTPLGGADSDDESAVADPDDTVLTPAVSGGGTAAPPPPGAVAPGGSTDAEAPTVTPGHGSTVPDDPLATMTRAGVGMGTPAYMAPEQARGEWDLDARADVFGLGAVLCTILTGKSPFAGGDAVYAFKKSAAADLADALAGLDACDADDELKALCRGCLSATPIARPADGAAVAAAVRGYEDGVRRRLQEERSTRVAAEVRAAEEKKRRRVWAGLASLAVLLIAGIAGAGWWYQADRAEKRAAAAAAAAQAEARAAAAAADVRGLIDRAAALRDGYEFDAAADLLTTAARRLPAAADPALAAAHEQAAKDLAVVRELDRVRLEVLSALGDAYRTIFFDPAVENAMVAESFRSGFGEVMAERDENREGADEVGGATDGEEIDEGPLAGIVAEGLDHAVGDSLAFGPDGAFATAYREYGIDVTAGDSADVGRAIATCSVADVLVDGLIDWADSEPDPELAAKLRGAADIAAPGAVLSFIAGKRPPELLTAVAAVDPATTRPVKAVSIADALSKAGENRRAASFVQIASAAHPADFWLHVHSALHSAVIDTGESSPDGERADDEGRQALGHLKAAAALRPGNSLVTTLLATLALSEGDMHVAVATGRAASAAAPTDGQARFLLGNLLDAAGQPDEALKHLRRAAELAPESPTTHLALGRLAGRMDLLDEAEASFRAALAADPELVEAYYERADVLDRMGRHAEATESRRATDSVPVGMFLELLADALHVDEPDPFSVRFDRELEREFHANNLGHLGSVDEWGDGAKDAAFRSRRDAPSPSRPD